MRTSTCKEPCNLQAHAAHAEEIDTRCARSLSLKVYRYIQERQAFYSSGILLTETMPLMSMKSQTPPLLLQPHPCRLLEFRRVLWCAFSRVKLLHRCFVSLNPVSSHCLNVTYAHIWNLKKKKWTEGQCRDKLQGEKRLSTRRRGLVARLDIGTDFYTQLSSTNVPSQRTVCSLPNYFSLPIPSFLFICYASLAPALSLCLFCSISSSLTLT